MNFSVEETILDEVKIISPKVYADDRGYFTEVFNANDFEILGIPYQFKQMNHSSSKKGVVRGLHFQWDPPMGKLMRVTRGIAFLVAVDIRLGSPTFGQWVGGEFSEWNRKQIWAPHSFARGFCAITDEAEVQYLITGTYNPVNESEILWNDKDLNIPWPVENPIVSPKDQKAQTLQQWIKSDKSKNIMYGKRN